MWQIFCLSFKQAIAVAPLCGLAKRSSHGLNERFEEENRSVRSQTMHRFVIIQNKTMENSIHAVYTE